VARIAVAALIVMLTAFGADELTPLEQRLFDLFTDMPGWVRSGAEVGYRAGTIGTVVVVLLAFVLTRRFRLVSMLILAGALAGLAGIGLRAPVDAATVRTAAGLEVDGAVPEYPVVVLAVATTILLVAAPYLLRPARRLVFAVLAVAAASAVLAVVGLPDDVLGGWALGWGVAALVHLAVGTPAATPSIGEVDDALRGLGVAVTGLRLAPAQVWGETRFTARAPDGGAVSIELIGRDAADARLLAKVWRWVWFKDSGPTIALTRTQQLEHRAYLLLLAERAGVQVSSVVIAGIAGARETALLVLREPDGLPLPDAERVTDSVLDDAWQNLARLHEAGLAHGMTQAANVVLLADGTTAFVDFAHASSGAPAERRLVDAVELLATTAALVGEERALASAIRALGREGLADVLPLLEPAALSAETRRELPERNALLTRLREQGAALTGGEVATLTKLRRVSPGDLLIAGGTILGVYLLIGQLAGIDFATVFDNAEWGWVGIAFLISPLPQFTGAIALMGSVSAPLRYGAVVGEQFANNFSGLIGGTIATTALVIRFFQKQGLAVAVAASSGVLNSVAGFVVQAILVIVGLAFTGSEFTASSTGGKDLAGLAVVLIVVAGLALGAMLLVPRLRRWTRGVVQPQWEAARANLRDILTTPREAVMLFGGNLGSQVLYALVLGASLHAYGGSLPLMQLIVINSLASVVGGMAPVPGGMGVVEAGLIGGLTAAGIPQSEAVAATFTHRLFTAYLPPIWGWFALQWLRRQDYV
jgi:glycosyltransferase 2 family protein